MSVAFRSKNGCRSYSLISCRTPAQSEIVMLNAANKNAELNLWKLYDVSVYLWSMMNSTYNGMSTAAAKKRNT